MRVLVCRLHRASAGEQTFQLSDLLVYCHGDNLARSALPISMPRRIAVSTLPPALSALRSSFSRSSPRSALCHAQDSISKRLGGALVLGGLSTLAIFRCFFVGLFQCAAS